MMLFIVALLLGGCTHLTVVVDKSNCKDVAGTSKMICEDAVEHK